MRKMILLCLMFFVMFATGCTSAQDAQDDQFWGAILYPDSTELLHKENIDEGILYFYEDGTGFHHLLVAYDGNVYVNNTPPKLAPKKCVQSLSINDDPRLNIIILAGVISNEKIQQITLKEDGYGSNFGVIYEPNSGMFDDPEKRLKIWNIMFEKGYTPKEPFKIKGFSNKGEVLCEDEVFIK